MRTWKVGALAGAVALLVAACNVPFDFTADGKADVIEFEAPGGPWFRVGDTATPPQSLFYPGWDLDHPIAVAGDYDGNHEWEPAVVAGRSQWITGGGRGTFTYAAPPDLVVPPPAGVTGTEATIVPVPADYDGDGKTDAAWYREADATWWIENQPGPIQFGTPPVSGNDVWYDIAQPADYDGDGRADLAVYHPRTSTFSIRGQAQPIAVGYPDGKPAVADYNGDGKADPAVYNVLGYAPPYVSGAPPNSAFFIAGQPSIAASGDGVPIPGNYDGQRGDEAATFDLDTSQVWIEGQGVIGSAFRTVLAPATTTLSIVRLARALRCDYQPDVYHCPPP